MDIEGTLVDLRKELAKVEAAIVVLEEMKDRQIANPAKSRGRKSMGHEERIAVSERMKRYWDARRTDADRNRAEIAGTVSALA